MLKFVADKTYQSMEKTLKLNLPISFPQLLDVVKQLSSREKQRLITFLKEDTEEPTKEDILNALKEDYISLQNGTLKTRPLKDVLDEL